MSWDETNNKTSENPHIWNIARDRTKLCSSIASKNVYKTFTTCQPEPHKLQTHQRATSISLPRLYALYSVTLLLDRCICSTPYFSIYLCSTPVLLVPRTTSILSALHKTPAETMCHLLKSQQNKPNLLN